MRFIKKFNQWKYKYITDIVAYSMALVVFLGSSFFFAFTSVNNSRPLIWIGVDKVYSNVLDGKMHYENIFGMVWSRDLESQNPASIVRKGSFYIINTKGEEILDPTTSKVYERNGDRLKLVNDFTNEEKKVVDYRSAEDYIYEKSSNFFRKYKGANYELPDNCAGYQYYQEEIICIIQPQGEEDTLSEFDFDGATDEEYKSFRNRQKTAKIDIIRIKYSQGVQYEEREQIYEFTYFGMLTRNTLNSLDPAYVVGSDDNKLYLLYSNRNSGKDPSTLDSTLVVYDLNTKETQLFETPIRQTDFSYGHNLFFSREGGLIISVIDTESKRYLSYKNFRFDGELLHELGTSEHLRIY